METLLKGGDYLAGDFSYADIAFYIAQFFAARHTVPIGPDRERLLQWRSRMAHRPAVAPVIGAMVEYLRGTALPVPEYGA
jgi:glutathione S-transferase